MGAPPVSVGAVQLRDTVLDVTLGATSPVGAAGTTAADVVADAFAEYGPVPAEFVAATLKSYDVAADSPATVTDGVVEDVPSAYVVHMLEPAAACCTI